MRYASKLAAWLAGLSVALAMSVAAFAGASPFGQGLFGEDVPFGSLTSVSINLGSAVSLSLTPDGPHLRGTGSHLVTVTSNDVVGYQLFVRASNGTNLQNGAASIAASGNSVPAPLSVNSWGYNTDGGTDFMGILSTPTLIKDTTGPSTTGDTTTITYQALTDTTQEAGAYTTSVAYLVVAENQ